MEKILRILVSLLLLFGLLACTACDPWEAVLPESTAEATTEAPTTEVPTTEAPTTEAPTTEAPTETEPPETEPLHSPLYLPDYSVEDVITYFNEVVLTVEYNNGDGDPSLVQKWLSPIYYRIQGEPSEQDLAVLEDFVAQLNRIPGFPGMEEVSHGESLSNITIYFVEREPFEEIFSDVVHGDFANGAVEFWYYTDTNEIYSASVGVCLDVGQESRNSILPEEIINMLGITDTVLREDSIVYQYSDENTALSDMDLLILKLLYSPEIRCGMTAEECEAVIRELYD
ncbi:MAG: DUF2927 domain-containing protein [Oscillospiraceae bacterium]|nr:DUF2927 domain-containing protein [Oscillospiraceae bacterium]